MKPVTHSLLANFTLINQDDSHLSHVHKKMDQSVKSRPQNSDPDDPLVPGERIPGMVARPHRLLLVPDPLHVAPDAPFDNAV